MSWELLAISAAVSFLSFLFGQVVSTKRCVRKIQELEASHKMELSERIEDELFVVTSERDAHKAAYEEEKRRAQEFSDKIGDIIREREVWREWYVRESAGHGAAQNLMMDTINTLATKLQKHTGKKVPLAPIIEQVRKDWDMVGGEDIRGRLQTAAQAGRLVEAAAEERKKEKADRQEKSS